MWPLIIAAIVALFVLYMFSFRILVHILCGGMFALLLVWLPEVLTKYVLSDIFGTQPSVFLYLLSLGAIILVVYLCVEKNLKKNRILDISLGLGLIMGLFITAIRLLFGR